MTVEPVTPLLHDIADVVSLTSIGRTKIYEEISTGRLESVRVGSRRLVPHDALIAYVEQLRTGATSGQVA